MPSLFDFSTTAGFRKKLLTRNLTPYAKAPNRPTPPIDYEYIQTDSSVQDSPDQLIDEPTFANRLYPLNQWGSEGGYRQAPDPTGLLNTRSNEGEYGPGQQDAHIIDQALPESLKWKSINAYSDGTQSVFDSGEYITEPDWIRGGTTLYNNQPYPTTFNPSSYGPVSILLFQDPQGSNGLLSQDSFIARLGAQTLRRYFEENIATEIRRNTIGRANVFNVASGTDILDLVTGRVPLIEPNYRITVPTNPILAATDFALRLAGSILPVSPIAGSYFDPSINPGLPTTISQLQNAFRRSNVGNFFNRLLGGTQTGSQLFLNNTGGGQRSRLFGNIDYNKYKPSYDRNIFDRVSGAIVGTPTNNSDYYIGSRSSEPSQVFSPPGVLPVNYYGQVQQSPVYGPSEMAQLYEGADKNIKLGANGPTYSDGGGIEGGFTWVSPRYKGNAGKKVGIGGLITQQDQNEKPSSYDSTESTNQEYREGSILDDTQRLIDSQPEGGKRLQHVGNAIDQVSKVFNDGYKEMTKGSRVYKYVGEIGTEVGSEYCRVFAKDTPYLQYNDLQKQDGITTKGRRFSDSVLDNTYNLNIVPNKQEGGQASTNLIGTQNNAYAKKYMFSIENLAWRTSSTPGFSVSDLAVCERGPNGGRVMWFPPYGLKFSETVNTGWNSTEFLGRPEPIYTYKSTQRGGSLSWKIVVDHPSVLNVIVNKVLEKENNRDRINGMIESFFAGCLKYDLYELAKKYWNVNPNDLFQLQQAISSKELTKEQIEWSKQTIQTGVDGGQGQDVKQSTNTSVNFDKYKELGFYFGNAFPKVGDTSDYSVEYTRYTSQSNKEFYAKKSPSTAAQTSAFFSSVVTPNYDMSKELINDIITQLTQYKKGTITINLISSCSAPASDKYNEELSKRRIESVLKYFKSNKQLNEFITKNQLLFKTEAVGEDAQVKKFNTQTKQWEQNLKVFCKSGSKVSGGDTLVADNEIFTTDAMSCRRVAISEIKVDTNENVPPSVPTPRYTDVLVSKRIVGTAPTTEQQRDPTRVDNITKKVLMSLLSECDYFEVIKENTPMVFDNLRDKLKFFQPAFHSMTPEGLNSRLTFLQQCMRPGDTIPTIKDLNGSQTLQYNNAVNTAFGAPPVLILRVGDFYNTKIIPNSLQIDYEDLDLNPEGIGVQPMIANITLSFNFVGGSGLKESIDKLQNAITFNYYANTEIYDNRADVTAQEEFLKVLDKEFLDIAKNAAAPAENQSQNNNGQNNNQTIGSIITKQTTETEESGTISYGKFMDGFVSSTQTYFTNVINKQKEITSQYNNAVRQQWMIERNYTNGVMPLNTNPIVLFGKSNNVENRFNKIFDDLEKNISDESDPFIKFMSRNKRGFSDRVIDTLKTNFINFLKNKRGSFQNAATTITQDFTNIQTQYIQKWSRANIICFAGKTNHGTDGFQIEKGNVKVYAIFGLTGNEVDKNSTASNTLDEFNDDLKKIQDNITAFNQIIWKPKQFIYPTDNKKYQGNVVFETNNGKATENTPTLSDVFNPFSKDRKFKDESFRREYMLVSQDVLDEKKYITFKNALIDNIVRNPAILGNGKTDVEQEFDEYWMTVAKPSFKEENDITKSFLDSVEKNDLKDYIKYTPFPSKKRNMSFTSNDVAIPSNKQAQIDMIKGLANQTNQNTNVLTWNDVISGAYISKAKLN